MKTVICSCLVATAIVLGHLEPMAAQTARFRHLVSVYVDGAGAGLHLPEGIACGRNGQFVVGDTGNDRLLRYTYLDKAVTGGTEIRIPQVSAPYRIQLNSKGEIYALDGKHRRIVRLGPNGEFKEILKFDGVPPPATVIPKDFTIDAADNLYVLDVFSARVLVLNSGGQFQKALALPAGIGFGSSLSIDVGGTLLVLDAIERRILAAASGADGFTPLGGDLTEFVPTLPTYMTASKGVIFVVEGTGSSIVGFGRDGSFLSRQLAMGWNEGSLNHPSQVCISDSEEIFIADRDNSRIQVFQLMR